MTSISTSQAVWQQATGEALQLGTAEVPELAPNEILIRNAAIAINPLDAILQDHAILPWLDYPAILGSDIAGHVVAVGDAVERFKLGDRVLAQAVGTTINQPAQGAFQLHTVALDHMAAPIPDGMAFSEAAVLPLGLGTAASGLYGRAQLALDPPSLSPSPRDEIVLVWGASSSVGCNAVQLAVASGYTCIATASPRNADMVKALGASAVLDHASPSIVEDVVAAIAGRALAGTLHATGDMAACFAVVSRCAGARTVAATLAPPEQRPDGVDPRQIAGTSLKDDAVGLMIYRDFLPYALANSSYRAAPSARVTGHGLEALQGALELMKLGVSSAKLVVTLS